jgi:hypothetical protein
LGARLRSASLGLSIALAVVSCGGGIPEVGEPVGEPVLPDLAPVPPVDLRTRAEGDRVTVRFSSTLVNVGDGDFLLRGTRAFDEWTVEQEIRHSGGGGQLTPTEAAMVWGGDGHEHWHIERVATYTLYRLDENGEIVENDIELPDAKIGFCFYDHSRVFEDGPAETVYRHEECGDEEDNEIRMGMSTGWSDKYDFDLPGQSIDVTDLEDGLYRVVGVADAQGWFEEANEENNVTWLDFELMTQDDLRLASLRDIGPNPTEPD